MGTADLLPQLQEFPLKITLKLITELSHPLFTFSS